MDIITLAIAKSFAKSYTDAALAAFPKGIHWLGEVNYYVDLPSNPSEGDAYTVKYTGTSGTEIDGTEYAWGINQTTQTSDWIDLGPNMSLYQKLLVSGENIKTINGNSVLGSGDMIIATNQEFPSTWPVSSSTTTKAFCNVVNADSTAVEGMSYLGEVMWSDLPFNGNAEVVVQIMSGTGTSNKVIHLILTSGNVAPYRWEYTYWNNGSNVSGWIGYATISTVQANPTLAGTESTLTGLEVAGTKYKLGYLPLSGGTMTGNLNITDNNASIKTSGGYHLLSGSTSSTKLGNNSRSTIISSDNNNIYHDKNGSTYDILDTSNTAANPTLAGTEATLTGLKVNGTSYKVPTFDPTTISGYDATKVQVLVNNLGTLTWVEGTTYASLNNTQYGGNQ